MQSWKSRNAILPRKVNDKDCIMKVTAVVPAAGAGLRFSKKKGPRKPFFIVKGKPLLIHTLRALEDSGRIDDIVVAIHKDDLAKCRKAVKRFNLKKVRRIITGGKTRFESVKRGLSFVADDAGIILIHDGARPLIDKNTIRDTIEACRRFGAVVCGVPVVSTVKFVDRDLIVKTTPDRKGIYAVQTPQVFKRDIILKAYYTPRRSRSQRSVTDDSMLVERLGYRVKMIPGFYENIKVTAPQDLMLVEALLRRKRR